MEFVLSVDVVCSTNHQPFLHADSLKTHKQTWRCMQTAYKFDVEQTKPRVSNCFTEMNLEQTEPLVLDWLNKKAQKIILEPT